MPSYAFRLVNVFGIEGDPFSGNPLCVFEDARGLPDAHLQALARQFNLSETTFIDPSSSADGVDASFRIFTPTFEMPFAGHPTLGTAHVVSSLAGGKEALELRAQAGKVTVRKGSGGWRLRAVAAPTTRPPEASREELAQMLGVAPEAVLPGALWVNTGVEHLVIPLRTPEDVRALRPDVASMRRLAAGKSREAMAYVWAPTGPGTLQVRYLYVENGALLEDPATGSACANLGGWWVASQKPLPLRRVLRQGEHTGRPSILELEVDAQGAIFVSGQVAELGRGRLELPSLDPPRDPSVL